AVFLISSALLTSLRVAAMKSVGRPSPTSGRVGRIGRSQAGTSVRLHRRRNTRGPADGVSLNFLGKRRRIPDDPVASEAIRLDLDISPVLRLAGFDAPVRRLEVTLGPVRIVHLVRLDGLNRVRDAWDELLDVEPAIRSGGQRIVAFGAHRGA